MALRIRISVLLAILSFATPAISVNLAVTNFRGAWSSTATYSAGMVTTYQGGSYISLLASNKNHVPSTPSKWWAAWSAPPSATSTSQWIVKDSTGKTIGPYVPGPSEGVYAATPLGSFVLTIDPQLGFVASGDPNLYFTSDDCSGDPYVEATTHTVLPVGYLISIAGFDVQLIDLGPPQSIAVHSVRSYLASCHATNGTGPFSRYIYGINVDSLGFTPPFVAELQ